MDQLNQRIKIYEEAITFYEGKTRFVDSVTNSEYCGFCFYFSMYVNYPIVRLIELMSLKPKCNYKKGEFWWNPQDRDIRIKKLKEALILAKREDIF